MSAAIIRCATCGTDDGCDCPIACSACGATAGECFCLVPCATCGDEHEPDDLIAHDAGRICLACRDDARCGLGVFSWRGA